ncbi:hypothetical protein KP509_19G047800 [Ceratopteris richardii]|uniref:Growth-regulating factor n=1 Tax=Ceratopteris richardii TaxID=49495 RepID=A0A8T2SP95_CERRI|nr:hypothetical protein KP509_19G047800 [Ceratopteris richardii]
MDLEEALHQKRGGRGRDIHGNCGFMVSGHSKGSDIAGHNDESNSNTCSAGQRLSAWEDNGGRLPMTSDSLFPSSYLLARQSTCRSPSAPQQLIRPRTQDGLEFDSLRDPRLLKLARLHDSPCPSPPPDMQVLVNLNGGFNASSNGAAAPENQQLHISSLMSSAPTSSYAGAVDTCSLISGGTSSHPKPYPFSSSHDEHIRQRYAPFMLSAGSSQTTIIPSMRSLHGNISCFSSESITSPFTSEQLREFTQQTYVFKHLMEGITPPNNLLLPIINSVATMGRLGVGTIPFTGNAALMGVGTLRGVIDPEPGRCRRTDGKKWRCSREVVPDHKYCDRHMHRGRHRARLATSIKAVNTDSDALKNPSPRLPLIGFTNPAVNATVCESAPLPDTAPAAELAPREPQLQFSLRAASAEPASLHRFGINHSHTLSENSAMDDSGQRSNELSSRSSEASEPPNLAALLLGSHSVKTSPINRTSGLEAPLSFGCQKGDPDADTRTLRRLVDANSWPGSSQAPDRSPPPTSLLLFDQLVTEQSNTELSIATIHQSLPGSFSDRYGEGDEQKDVITTSGSSSGFASRGMETAFKVGSVARQGDETRYSRRVSWRPSAWESPGIGGPLGEALQLSAATRTTVNHVGAPPIKGGELCLNLIEESWVQRKENEERFRVGSPDKGSHSPSLASPTGVLQMRASFASYSDSSSSASSPRSAFKVDSANLTS